MMNENECGQDECVNEPKYEEPYVVPSLGNAQTLSLNSEAQPTVHALDTAIEGTECGNDSCSDVSYDSDYVVPALPEPDCGGGGGGGGTGDGHKYTFSSTATGWRVYEDGKLIYSYTDKDTDTTYTWQSTTEGWIVKNNKGETVFTYTDKSGENTTYSFEDEDNCGFKVTDSTGKVVYTYENKCAGTTYTFKQTGNDFDVTNNQTGQVVFTYNGTDDTNTTYTWENYKDGFKVTDSDGVVAYTYDPKLGGVSDGSYQTVSLLTTAFWGNTNVSLGQITGLTAAKVVLGETLVYDNAGTVGVITADNEDGTYKVTTMTTSPGTRQGVRLGSVEAVENLPATCAAAEALGWQTPQLGDFAYVTSGGAGDEVSEYLITSIDDDCNITWTFSHKFNAGNYQEQSTTSMSGMILTGGAVQGTFGTPLDPATFIRGVKRNGVSLTPDANGVVDVQVDESHIIVNGLPASNIVDGAEYIVIDNNHEVTGTWVHDNTGWYQTYAPVKQIDSHQVVTELPATDIQANVEYVVVDDNSKVTGTWVYFPNRGWLQTEKEQKPAHIVVATLPTTGIDDTAEYVQVEDLADPVNTYEATYVHTNQGWVKIAEAPKATDAHIAVTALPTTNINETAEYLVMTNTNDPSTLTGTWVRVNGNWVQTEKMSGEGYHIVTSLPTSNIDDKSEYIVVGNLNNPNGTLLGHYAYDKNTNTWIDLNPSSNVTYQLDNTGEELDSLYCNLVDTPITTAHNTDIVYPLTQVSGKGLVVSGGNSIVLKAGKRYQIDVALTTVNTATVSTNSVVTDMYYFVKDITNNVAIAGGMLVDRKDAALFGSGVVSCEYTVPSTGNATIQLHTPKTSQYNTVNMQVRGPYSHITVHEIGRAVDPVAYLDQNGEAEDTPVGTVQAYMGTEAPENWLLCDGTTYAVGTYPELETFIIQNYGAVNYFGGNGTTTWVVPDLRGEFLRGSGTNSHANSGNGATVGTHQNATAMPSIGISTEDNKGFVSITKAASTNTVYWPGYDGADTTIGSGTNNYYSFPTSNTNTSPRTLAYTSRPTNTSVNWIIKAKKTAVVVTGDIGGDSIALKMAQPNTWPNGVEQSFGNGVYGARMAGTISGTANSAASAPITAVAANKTIKILDYGGWSQASTNDKNLPAIPYAGQTVSSGVYLRTSDGQLMFYHWANEARTNIPFEVWVTYTKN